MKQVYLEVANRNSVKSFGPYKIEQGTNAEYIEVEIHSDGGRHSSVNRLVLEKLGIVVREVEEPIMITRPQFDKVCKEICGLFSFEQLWKQMRKETKRG